MEKPEYIVVFVTTSTAEEAQRIAQSLLERRKAACVNIIPKLDSRFWWEGKIDSSEESLLIIKTRASLLPEIINRVKEIHSYSVPEIIALPIIGGNQDYLDWISKETAQGGGQRGWVVKYQGVMDMLTREELERYARQIMINGFGEEGQEKLKRVRVFVAGAGGLGSPIAIYLAAAGVGTIRLVDHDRVELSNLNRQVLHWDENIGMSKADSALQKLHKLNPTVKIETMAETITEANVSQLAAGFDLIVDAMDNLPTRYLLNKAAIEKNIPFFHGAVYGFEGRAMTVIPGKTACLNCIYRGVTPPGEKFPVIGVTPAVIGCIQATEVIKYIVGLGNLLTNSLLVYDALEMTFTRLKVKKDPNCEHCGAH